LIHEKTQLQKSHGTVPFMLCIFMNVNSTFPEKVIKKVKATFIFENYIFGVQYLLLQT